MNELGHIVDRLDSVITRARLNAIALMLTTDRSERLLRMAAALQKLPPGGYLLGAGPSTVGIIPLSVDEVVLGRSSTPLETPSETLVDYAVADTMYFTPMEVSRAHARVCRRREGAETFFTVEDMDSTCGTFVNGEELPAEAGPHELQPGDVISLGPNQISVYLFYVASEASDTENADSETP